MMALDSKLVTSEIILTVTLSDNVSTVVTLNSFTTSVCTMTSATPTELSQILVSQEVTKLGDGGGGGH